MTESLLESAKAFVEAFNQEWIVTLRQTLLKTCEEMIPLLGD